MSYVIDITMRTRTLVLANENYLTNLTQASLDALVSTTRQDLINSSTSLKAAQTALSLATSDLSQATQQEIDPNNLQMQYAKYSNMPAFYVFTMWEAIMEIVVAALRVSTMPLTQISDADPTVAFVMDNNLNAVMIALNQSTDAIINQSNSLRSQNLNIFLYLLIAATCSLFLSMVFLIPVTNRIKKGKQEVLRLFTHKNVEKHVDDQLKLCRNFIATKLQTGSEGGPEHDIDGDDIGGNINVNDKELQSELNNNKYMRRMRKKNKGKKVKELNTDFVSTLLKFLIFISVIEGYFLANYLLSQKFLGEVADLTTELKLLHTR